MMIKNIRFIPTICSLTICAGVVQIGCGSPPNSELQGSPTTTDGTGGSGESAGGSGDEIPQLK